MKLPTQQIQELAAKEMDRKEFLQFIGAGILGVVGVWGLLSNLQKLNSKPGQSQGYGSRTYGR